MAESFPNRSKTLREKEKLLVTSNFSFYNSVFNRLVPQTRKNQSLFVKGLTDLEKESFYFRHFYFIFFFSFKEYLFQGQKRIFLRKNSTVCCRTTLMRTSKRPLLFFCKLDQKKRNVNKTKL